MSSRSAREMARVGMEKVCFITTSFWWCPRRVGTDSFAPSAGPAFPHKATSGAPKIGVKGEAILSCSLPRIASRSS